MKEDIEEYNTDIKLAAPPRWLTKPEIRTGKSHSSLIISFLTASEAKFALNNRLIIAGKVVKTSPFIESKSTTQCHRCQKFGHHQQTCKSTPQCQFCGQEHHTTLHSCPICESNKQCTHLTLQCVNCQGKHKATDKRCEVYRKLLEKNTTTDFVDLV